MLTLTLKLWKGNPNLVYLAQSIGRKSLKISPISCKTQNLKSPLNINNKKSYSKCRPPLWSSGQSSWLQIQRSGFDSGRYQIFRVVVGLEQGPHSLMSTTEELLGRKSSGSSLEIREYGHRDLSRWQSGTLDPQKLALTSPKSGGCSVSIVHWRI
jgi:hypothetical protein